MSVYSLSCSSEILKKACIFERPTATKLKRQNRKCSGNVNAKANRMMILAPETEIYIARSNETSVRRILFRYKTNIDIYPRFAT